MDERTTDETESVDAAAAESVETVDLELQPEPTGSGGGRLGAIVFGFAALVAMIVGLVAISGGFSDDETEVASEDDAAQVEDDAEADEPADPEPVEAEDAGEPDEAMLDETEDEGVDMDGAADAALAIGGYDIVDQAYFVEGRGFVGIGYGPNGQVLRESVDGTEWASVDITGIPDEGQLVHLTPADDEWFALVEIWPEFEGDEGAYIFEEPTPDRLLASSEDLVSWTTTPLPEVSSEEGTGTYFEALAASNGQIVLAGVSHPNGGDEMRILLDAGRITEEELVNMCGWDGAYAGRPFTVFSCDHELDEAMMALEEQMASLDSDEEQAAIEAEMDELLSQYEEPEPLLVIESDDPLYPELVAISEANQEPKGIVVTGPIGGPFEVSNADYFTTVAGTTDGFVGIRASFNDDPSQYGSSAVLASTDGRTWTEVGTADTSWGRITNAGDTLILTGDGPDGSKVLSSTDGGATWTPLAIDSTLYGAWAEVMAGPAGVVISYQGTVEPMPGMAEEPTEIMLEKDGYVLVNAWGGVLDGPLFTLSTADGTLIYEVSEEEMGNEDGVTGKLRFDGQYGQNLVFLDPDTGEDLVSFTEEDYDKAYSETFGDIDYAFEPDFVTEIWFSSDGGTSWQPLEADLPQNNNGTYSRIMAVGDDEVLAVIQTWSEAMPPAELLAFENENREPTEDEIAALDAWSAEQNSTEWVRIPVG